MRNYRGKRKDNGEWAYGWYAKIAHKHLIITDNSKIATGNNWWFRIEDFVEVLPESVGQSTGLKDKDGVEIYEGDVLSPGKREVLFGVYDTQFEQGNGWHTRSHEAGAFPAPFSFSERQAEVSEVIGNATDNPGLLEGGQ